MERKKIHSEAPTYLGLSSTNFDFLVLEISMKYKMLIYLRILNFNGEDKITKLTSRKGIMVV